ncbi:MAG: FtsQ-type POTRA domain-containing protein, partial [Spirochaetia bacterium]|nr:FtsQ-type POTRA domain-containing protein [Spirochaetia bacterium]
GVLTEEITMSSIDIYPGYSFQVKHKSRTVNKKILLFVFLFILGLASMEAVFMLFISPNLKIQKVQVEAPASVALSSSEILELAGITDGDSYFAVDAAEVERRLLENNLIQSAVVEKHFPSEIKIAVEGREPFAITFIDVDGRTVPVTLDREGIIFEIGEGVTDYELPVISGLTFQNLKLGTQLPSMFIPYLSRLSAVKQSSFALFEKISEIKFVEKTEGTFDVVIYPSDSSIRIRTSSDISDRMLQQMFTVLDVMEENGIDKQTDELDFRGGKIVYKVKEG